ncbi:MAG: glycosyltransferase family 2 protein [Cyclobacteriaceae bacterium]
MSTNLYLERYAWKDPILPEYEPKKNLKTIIVIPSFRETQLQQALDSINNCDPPKSELLILVVINEPAESTTEITEINRKCLDSLKKYDSNYELVFSYQKLPKKKAGVGLARKIGMDEAVRIFEKVDEDGVIICYDSDCLCAQNYLIEIENHFLDQKAKAGIVFYEHQLNGQNKEWIIQYESYLRYYISGLRYAKYPHAHQTLGSCIIVRSSTYQKQGGMNSRQAGEDFYFLNKVIPSGEFVEVNTTTVYPSDRVSDRVPFGTGKAVEQLMHSKRSYEVYNPKIFEDLRVFFSQITSHPESDPAIIPDSISDFLGINIEKDFEEIRRQTTSQQAFIKRFFGWFDAFKILKYVHFARDNHHPNVGLTEALLWLDSKVQNRIYSENLETQLANLRTVDRQGLDQIK